MVIHAKTSGAALGGSLGVVIVAILHSVSGVHLVPEANAAIPAFLSALGAFLLPDPAAPVIQVPTIHLVPVIDEPEPKTLTAAANLATNPENPVPAAPPKGIGNLS